jgi:hypothetical protein
VKALDPWSSKGPNDAVWLSPKIVCESCTSASRWLFGALHAFRPAFHARGTVRDPWHGLQAVGEGLGRLVDPAQFGPFFLGLTLFALALTAAWLRTGTLWTAVGAHAGAVWVLYGFSPLMRWAPGPAWAGSKAVADGVPAWLVLAALALVLWPRRGPAGG